MIAKQGTSAPPEKLRGRAIVCEGPANHFANGLVGSTRDGGNQRFVVHRNAEWVRVLLAPDCPRAGLFQHALECGESFGHGFAPESDSKVLAGLRPKNLSWQKHHAGLVQRRPRDKSSRRRHSLRQETQSVRPRVSSMKRGWRASRRTYRGSSRFSEMICRFREASFSRCLSATSARNSLGPELQIVV